MEGATQGSLRVRVLLVNRFFGGSATPTGRMLLDVAEELNGAGHTVVALTSSTDYDSAAHRADPGLPGIEVRRVRLPFPRWRSAQWASFWLFATLRIPFLRWDRCVILTDPPFMQWAAAIARALGRKGIFWWTMDLYPQALVARGMIRRGGVLERCLAWLNSASLSHMEGVVCLGTRQRDLLEQYPSWPRRNGFCMVAPPWDKRVFEPTAEQVAAFRLRYVRGRTRLAVYAGNLGEAHLFEPIVEAARYLLAGGRDWHFLFVVRGARRAALERACAGLTNITVTDYQPPDLTAAMLGSADVHLITMRDGWDGVVVPSKLYGIAMTGKPVLFIGPAAADTSDEIRKYALGECLGTDCSPEAVASSLERLTAWSAARASAPPSNVAGLIARFVVDQPSFALEANRNTA